MAIDDIIAETTDVDALRAERKEQSLKQEMATPNTPREFGNPSLGDPIRIEKSTIQLGVDMATLVVLVLILLRL